MQKTFSAEIITSANQNLLARLELEVAGESPAIKVIWLDTNLNWIPNEAREIEAGLPIDEVAWNNLRSKGIKPKPATEEQARKAYIATLQRDAMFVYCRELTAEEQLLDSKELAKLMRREYAKRETGIGFQNEAIAKVNANNKFANNPFAGLGDLIKK